MNSKTFQGSAGTLQRESAEHRGESQDRVLYLGSRAGAGKESGASSGLNVGRTGHTGTEDLRGPAVGEAGGSEGTWFTEQLKGEEKMGSFSYLV